MDQNIKIRWL